jgi:hypothetical protein
MLPSVIAFRRHLENRNAIVSLNILILLIPGTFVMAPFLFHDSGSTFVMMFWSILFTNPTLVKEIPEGMRASIAVWSIVLGVFAIVWGKLLFEASQLKDDVVVKEAL